MNPKGLARFYDNIRKLQNKNKINDHELLGLFFDMYEILIALTASQAADEAMNRMFGGGPLSIHKVDPETFEEVVKRDKGKEEPPVQEGRIGPYL